MAKSFLRVFGPKSEQIHVYRSVVEPLLEEVNLIALPSISCRVHFIPLIIFQIKLKFDLLFDVLGFY